MGVRGAARDVEPGSARSERSTATRERILDAAERLFAERGVHAVSNRAIAEAAGQGNNAVVGYHFGTKTDLVRAVVARHAGPVDAIRRRMVAALPARPGLRDWVECLVLPVAEHLARFDPPTWYARLGAQLFTDPGLRAVIVEESRSAAVTAVVRGIAASLPDLPADVRTDRWDMCLLLLTHHVAERERVLAAADPAASADWPQAARRLTDAVVGILTSPSTAPAR